jgi:hypothetical protein
MRLIFFSWHSSPTWEIAISFSNYEKDRHIVIRFLKWALRIQFEIERRKVD